MQQPILLLVLALIASVASAASTTTTTTTTKATTTTSAAPTPTAPVVDVCGGKLRQRKAFSTLSDDEKKAYAAGVWAMKKSGKWDQYTLKHRTGMQWHMTTQFLLMHRALLTDFETELLKNAPGLSGLPFWDEFSDSGNPLKSSVFSANGLAPMAAGPLGAPFAGLTDDKKQLVTRDPDTSGSGAFKWIPQAQVMAAALTSYKTFGEMSHAIELTPHNSYHMLAGGHMGDPSISPADPLFWLHHAYIDTLWAGWQGMSAAHFTDLTVPGRGRGDIQVNPTAGTVLYEKQYTNTDMIYYRQRLCYEYKLPASLSPAQRAMRAMRALKDASNSTEASSKNTTTVTFPPVEPMPVDRLKKMMPMIDEAEIAQRVADCTASLNAAAAKLNAYVATKADNATNPADAVAAAAPNMHDLLAESHEYVAAQIKDDYKDSAIPAVKAMSVDAAVPAVAVVAAPSSAATKVSSSIAAVAAIAAALLA